MNHRLLSAAFVAIASTATLLPSVAHATDATIPDSVPKVCTVLPPVGPSRGVHPGNETTLPEATPPECSAIQVCVVFALRNQIRPQTQVTEPDCAGVDPACVIQLTPTGPSRTVHSAPGVVESMEIKIPLACQEVLAASLAAIPKTGGNTGPVVWIATSLVLVGGALLIGQRRFGHR